MIAGQMIDFLFEGKKMREKDLLLMHCKKTAYLFAASFEFSAILADLSFQKRKLFRKMGLCYGLCYQLADDIEDAEEDLILKKATSVTLFGKARTLQLHKSFFALFEKYFAILFDLSGILWIKESLQIC